MLKSFYLHNNAFYIAGTAAALFVLSYFFPVLYTIGLILLLMTGIAILLDALLLYAKRKPLSANREMAERLSLGDENPIRLLLRNDYGFNVKATVIDELPFQFQERKWQRKVELVKNETYQLIYHLSPKERGSYDFGNIIVIIKGPLGIVQRRFELAASQEVPVYPSYIQLRRYQLLATSNHLQLAGMKRIRKLGHSLEFEQIKEYVRGEDYRTINWKATARRGDLMVNSYTDEKSQQIYCVINKGRLMKMPFDGITLFDYAINASLVLSSVVISKQDKAGLITFAEKSGSFLPADKKATQMSLMMETLYRQKTNFLEADYENLYALLRNRVTQRSLLVLFTNFETVEGLQRELPALKMMARYHLLLVVIFENTEIGSLLQAPAGTIEEIYIKTIAGKYAHEKKQIIQELRRSGILSILTTPANLTINTLNKYLELKRRNQV